MIRQTHFYHLQTKWIGNLGSGTKNYRSYARNYTINISGKPPIYGSSDPSFVGDATKHNPEELLLAALSSCHMLWYLHLCAEAAIVVLDYQDNAQATMIENTDGSGFFKEVVLNPTVKVADESMLSIATKLHEKANQYCFIANSVNFPVHHQPVCTVFST
ncbi:OsmC family protein [Olivibacter ginsenosidimutans]|uniref:OsmC family protein n=1 Tax=Olivibacter ginsenosidimutans TaxID=1176537 RepID=A0ABP9BPA6_9SPHI